MRRVAFLALLALAGSATAQSRITLRQAVAEALDRNPAIVASTARERVARAGLEEARSMWLPRLDASQTLMRSNNPVFVFGSLLEQGRFGAANFDPAFLNDPDALTNSRLAVNLRYTFFDQFRRWNAVEQARNGVAQAASGSDEARQRMTLEVIARFYGALLADQRKQVAAESVASAEADVMAARARLEQGLTVEADALASDVQLASFRQQLISAEGELAIARAALATLMHRELSDPLELEGEIAGPAAAEPKTLEEALERAQEQRGALRAASRSAENARLQLQTSRGALLPRVDGFASWGASGSSLTGGDPDNAVGVIVGLDLFDGAKYARIARTRAELEVASADELAQRDAVRLEVISAWHRRRAAGERLEVATKAADQAAEAARIVRDRHEHGLTTITEQLRAQTALLSARFDLLAARYDHAMSDAELRRSIGGLNDVEDFQ